jgi:hypothetical protein
MLQGGSTDFWAGGAGLQTRPCIFHNGHLKG